MTPNWEIAERHAQDVVSWERSMHIEWEEGLQQTFLRLPELVRAMNVFYFVGHFVLTSIFFFWLYHTNRDGFSRFRNGFLAATVHRARHPLAVPDRAAAARRTSGSWTRSARSRTSTSARRPRRRSRTRSPPCPRCTPAGRSASAIGLVIYARPLFWKLVGVFYPIAVVLTIVVTGNHFVFDALAGMLVMGLGFWLTEWLRRRPDRRRSPPRAAPDGVFAARARVSTVDGATIVAATRGGAVR